MPAVDILDGSEIYSPREAGFLALVERSDCIVKLSGISVGPLAGLIQTTIDAASAKIKETDLVEHADFPEANQFGAGFAVLHAGNEGVWLLLHLWLPGGIASRHLWRADIETPSEFRNAPDHLMACVWELGIIDFERRAWIETVLAGKPLADYFAVRMPRSTV